MAIYHCSISNVSRSKGSSSCATLAYISGEKVHDDRTGTTYAYSRQERVLVTGTILPPSAPAEYADADTLFNAIEKYETADNARTAKKIQVALPKELGLAEYKTIIEDYIRHNLTKDGYAATYAIHDGGKKENYHAHILVANRPINAKGEWGIKSRKAYALDENGKKIPVIDEATGKQKERIRPGKGVEKVWKRVNVEQNPLDTKDFLLRLRKAWAEEVNRHLEPEQQIDHRSNSDRGIDDTPTIHEGYAARAMEERGEVSERCQTNRDIRQENEQRRQIKAELAAAIDQDKALEKKERELHERLGRVDGRRKNDELTGRTPEGERATESTATAARAVAPDHQTTGTRDYTAELLAYRREATEREIARISKEREEAARREREAAARKLADERKAAELRRQRETQERELQSAAKATTKRERPRQAQKTANEATTIHLPDEALLQRFTAALKGADSKARDII